MSEQEALELVTDWAVRVLPARVAPGRVGSAWSIRVRWDGETWECTSARVAADFLRELSR